MLGRFDFSIPLTVNRLHLLLECINRYKEMLYGETAALELNRYIIKILANKIYQEPKKVANSVDRHIDFILSHISDLVFPYDKTRYENADTSDLSELKEQYKKYLETLEKVEAEKEAKNVS